MPDRVDAAFLKQCPRLKVIACALKGFDNFDVEACTDAGVWVTIAPDLLTNPTAELAVGLAIALARRLREGDALMRSGTFKGWRPVLYGKGLDQSVVGIVGMGAVGRAIAARLAGFGCRILGVDPGRDMPDGVTAADLDVALAASDYLILAVPLTPATFHLIGREALKRMKPGALLVNIGRGSVVDEAAVADALDGGALGGYAADVFEMEDWALREPPALDRCRGCSRIRRRCSRRISDRRSTACGSRSPCRRPTTSPPCWPAGGRAMPSTNRRAGARAWRADEPAFGP